MPDPVIEVTQLGKQFRGGVRAVDDLSFTVHRGEICGLLGPNGAGKTTTLRMLLGLVRPSHGRARVLGEEMRPSSPVLTRVGALIEHAAFVPYLSGWNNLRLYWEAGGRPWREANVDDALAVAGLGNAVHRRVKTYSQGMRQRLGIARALLGAPEVLVLDEPTSGLDPGEMREVRRLLHGLETRGVTVLLSSHILAEVEQVCSHAVVMDRGRLVAAGTVDELTAATRAAYFEVDDVDAARVVLAEHPGVRAVRDEPPGLAVDLDGAGRAQLVNLLVGRGIAVETVMSRHRLEDAFLGLLKDE